MGTGTPEDVWREPWGNRRPLHAESFLESRWNHTAPKWDGVRLGSQGTKGLHSGRRWLWTDGGRDLRGREKVESPQSLSASPFLQLPLGSSLHPPSGSSLLHLTEVVRAVVCGSSQVPSPWLLRACSSFRRCRHWYRMSSSGRRGAWEEDGAGVGMGAGAGVAVEEVEGRG